MQDVVIKWGNKHCPFFTILVVLFIFFKKTLNNLAFNS